MGSERIGNELLYHQAVVALQLRPDLDEARLR